MVESHSPEHLRLFIAITVPDFVKEQIKRTQDRLRASLPQGAVAWTKPEQFHLTLRFLGNIEARSVEPLIDSIGAVCQAAHPLHLRAGGIGFFPNARGPRVVWIGVQESGERLLLVQEAVKLASDRFTAEKAQNRFSAHLTLGRIKHLSRQQTDTLARSAQLYGEESFGEWTATEIHVLRSLLSPEGAEHRILAAVPFLKAI